MSCNDCIYLEWIIHMLILVCPLVSGRWWTWSIYRSHHPWARMHWEWNLPRGQENEIRSHILFFPSFLQTLNILFGCSNSWTHTLFFIVVSNNRGHNGYIELLIWMVNLRTIACSFYISIIPVLWVRIHSTIAECDPQPWLSALI